MSHKQYFKKLDPAIFCVNEGYVNTNDPEALGDACVAADYVAISDLPTVCPANGYFDPLAPFVPPVAIPDPTGDQQILLLCDDMAQGVIAVNATVSSGSKKFECLDAAMNVLFTTTFSSLSYTYTFPTFNTGTYYIIRITPNTGGATLLTFSTYTSFNNYTINWRIIQAKFQTPNLTSLSAAFYGMISIQECIFKGAMNSLTDMGSLFVNSGIQYVTWPTSLNALTSIASIFSGTFLLKHMILPDAMVNLTNLSTAFKDSSIQTLTFMTALNSASNISLAQCCEGCTQLETVVLPTSMVKVTTIGALFKNCYKLSGKITFPALINITDIGSSFYQAKSIEEIEFTGASDLLVQVNSAFYSCPMLKKVTLPSTMNGMANNNWSNCFSGVPALAIIVMPTSMTSIGGTDPAMFTYTYNVREITTCIWSTNSLSMMIQSHQLRIFNQPTLRCSSFQAFYNSTTDISPYTTIEIDWANSVWGTNAPQIKLWGKMDANEINRIFTALPVVTGKTIDVRINPGYATCNKAIATAKGWTVT